MSGPGAESYRVHVQASDHLLAGQPGKAQELLAAEQALPLPSQVLDVAAMLLGLRRDRGVQLRRLLDRMNGSGASAVLTTLDPQGQMDMALFVERAVGSGEPPRETRSGLRMVGLDGAGESWDLGVADGTATRMIHVLTHCPSFCGDRFYVHLRDAEGRGESIRVAIERITFCDAELAIVAPSRIPRLLSFIVARGSCTVCLDGEAMVVTAAQGPLTLKLEISEDREAPGDVEANVLAVEVATTDAPGLPDQNLMAFQEARVLDCLEKKENEALLEALAIVRAGAPEAVEDLIRTVLGRMLDWGHAPDWLLDDLLRSLPSAEATQFRAAHADVWGTRVVEARDVTVRFYRSAHKLITWQRLKKRFFGGGPDDSFLVLDDVTFDLYKGDILGIIGRNGAGKSTLLRTISGMIPIEQGRVVLDGQHLLLSAGLGVRPELTGRENIFLGGYFMGLTHAEIAANFDEIVAFAELAHAIDQPFKFYSDGMKARLIFSMATSVSPQVLMLDELLSAGDLSFQAKAQRRMTELIEKAGAVVVVTHGVDFVRDRCTKAMYMVDGRVRAYGSPLRAVDLYLKDLHLLGSAGATDPAALAGMMAQAGGAPGIGGM